jgi:hypothetical protein
LRILAAGDLLEDLHEVSEWRILGWINHNHMAKQGAVLDESYFLVVVSAEEVLKDDAKPIGASIIGKQEWLG